MDDPANRAPPKAKPFARTALRRRGWLLPRLADHDLMAVLPCRTEEYGSFEYGGLPVTTAYCLSVVIHFESTTPSSIFPKVVVEEWPATRQAHSCMRPIGARGPRLTV
jgi:hypothetical protein